MTKLLIPLLSLATGLANAAPQPGVPWPASDGLARKLPTQAQTGPVKTDRHVGIFYFVWLGGHSKSGPYDLTEILKGNPANPAFGPKGDPEIIFLTGWNEWVAQRFLKEVGKAPNKITGRPLKPGDSYFVDAYSMEFSRDLEPMHEGYGDSYYYQMIANIRRYKGTPAIPTPPRPAPITIDGNFDDWNDIPALYPDQLHDTAHRDHEGWAGQRYRDTTGRNDLAFARVVRQEKTVSFLLHTHAPFTPPNDDRWMLLFLDADQDPSTGWYGYDYVVNRNRPARNRCTLERLQADGSTTPLTEIPIAFTNNLLELQLPILTEWTAKPLRFDFHLSDNAPLSRDFFLQGDHAPNRRFNFRYQTDS